MTVIRFDAGSGAQFEISPEKRTIKGLALPWDATAQFEGTPYSFPRGSVQWDTDNLSRIKIFASHDYSRPLGVVTALEETDEGLVLSARIARGPSGDEALAQAEDGVVDGLSVGFSADSVFALKDGVMVARRANVFEVSMTAVPAFSGSRLTSVAASHDNTKEINMENEETTEVTEAAQVSLSADEVRNIIADELKSARADKPVIPAGNPTGFAQFAVKEEPMYRFQGDVSGKYDFSRDVIAGTSGDKEALERVSTFMQDNLLSGPKFVTSSDTAAVNPTKYRSDMFKDEGPAQPTPLFDFFRKGGLSDITPFSYSQLETYGDLLDDHTEGVNPSGGTFSVEAGATITPEAISGKIFITREVHDQQGNPAVSALVWSKFQRVFGQMLEQKTAEVLFDGTYADFVTGITAGATGKVIADALEEGIVGLQFTPDGYRFQRMFGHVDLYTKLVGAKDDAGRKLFPIIAPQNADGVSDTRFGHINVAGLRVDPTWSLGTSSAGASAAAGVSYLADPNAVHVWNSGLTKLDRLNEDVAGYEIGAWAYFAGIVYDATGVKTVDYDLS